MADWRGVTCSWVAPARKRTWTADTSFWPRGLISYPSGRRCGFTSPSYRANFVNSTVRSADGAMPSTLRRRRQCRPPARRAHAPSPSIAHRACYCRLDLIHFADDVDCPRCAGPCGNLRLWRRHSCRRCVRPHPHALTTHRSPLMSAGVSRSSELSTDKLEFTARRFARHQHQSPSFAL